MDPVPGLLRQRRLLSQAWVWLACLLLAAQGGMPAVAPAPAASEAPSGASAVRFVRENRAILQARFATAAHVTQERASTADRRDGDNGHPPLLPAHGTGFAPPSDQASSWQTASNRRSDGGRIPGAYRARAPPRTA